MKKKVLHLITGLELGGGAENMLLQLLPKMQGDLDNCVCAIKGRGEIGKRLEEAGVPVHFLDLKNIFDLGIIFRYRKVLKEFQPDVQVNYLIHADIFGRIFGKIFGVKKIVPYIRNIHRNRKALMSLDKMTLPLADFVLTNSETAKKYYIEKMGAKADKIMCIPNGVDLSRFENLNVDVSQKKKEIGIAEKAFLIGTVARLEKQKDIPTLINAFEIVQKKHPEAHLLIVGHGSQKENLKKLIANLSIENKVTMLEKRTDNLELISSMDIFVLPSLNEGMSNALLEAMALKKPIIASDIEENVELIEDRKNGLIFRSGNAEELADCVLRIIENEYDFKEIKISTFEKVRVGYDLNVVKNGLEKTLKKYMRKFLSKYIAPVLWKYGKGSSRYDIYEYLKKQQWRSLDENVGIQKEKLYKILDYSIRNIPYYKRIAAENGINIGLNTIFEDVKKFPILTKEIIRKEFDNLCNYSLKEKPIRNKTGGTTGQPIEFLQSKNFKDWASANKMLFSSWCGLRDGERVVMLWGLERDVLARGKGINDYLTEYFMNDTILNSFNMSKERMDEYVNFIISKKPDLLIAYVQSIEELARYIKEKKIKIPFSLNVMTSAGTLYDHQRNLIEESFNGQVFNKYGSREASDMACECEKHEGLHLNPLTHYLEVLDNNLEKVENENESGEIYVTNLENFIMPLIRYKIGDSARVTNKECSCGRGLPMVKHITGRNIDGLRNAKGKFIPAEFFIHFIGVVFNSGYIDRFQVIQDSLNQITIRVKINNVELFEQFKPEIEKNIKKVFETDVRIIWKMEEEIRNSKSGKFRYVISNIISN